MKTFEITKEQILELTKGSKYYNEDALKQWFPEAFKTELKVGKWYKNDSYHLFCFEGTYYEDRFQGFGFDGLKQWIDYSIHDVGFHTDGIKEATTQEVETALINEAKKRGYKNGNYKCLSISTLTHNHSNDYIFDCQDNILFTGWEKSQRNVVFKNGIWATIIETITKEEAEKLLNKKIL